MMPPMMPPAPPQNLEAEQAVLGSILVSNAAYERVSEVVKAEHFANPLHGKIFDTLGRLIDRGQVVSIVTLKTYFEQDAALAEAGGTAYLTALLSASVHALDAVSYGRIVADAATRRRIIDLATEAMAAARSPTPDDSAARQIERLERSLYDVAEDGAKGGFQTTAHYATKATVAAELAHRRDGQIAGISTGLVDVDALLGGLHRSDLIILAGRPSMGKTALATNMAYAAARRHREETDANGRARTVDGAKVGFFSLEMSGEQLMNRVLAERAGVPASRVRQGMLSSKEMDRFITAAKELEDLPLMIDETPALSIGALRTRARRLQRQHGLGLIVVDYLQLVDASNRKDGRVQEVSEITRGLKTLAKELDVPVLALSQLNRSVESRQDKRPVLSDLRDSGSIEQDADVVMFVYREEYYLERGSDADRARLADVAGKAELLIAKQRHGPTGVVHLRFDGATTKFSDAVDDAVRTAA